MQGFRGDLGDRDLGFKLRTAPQSVTDYIMATIKVVMYLCYEYYPTVAESGQYPRFKV